MKRIIVHIGVEKTGTTTLQEFLHANRDRLREKKVAVLKSPGLRNHRSLATYCMSAHRFDQYTKKLRITSEATHQIWAKKFKRRLERELDSIREDESIIISSEHFHSRLHTQEEINKLQSLLVEYCSDIRIIVYLRRQDQVAVSLYSTLCRAGGYRNSVFPMGISENEHYYNYYLLLEKWSEAFGQKNIIPRIFERKHLLNQDLISDFIFSSEVIDPQWELIRPDFKNESLSSTAQSVTLLFNKNVLSRENSAHSYPIEEYRKTLIKELNYKYPGPPVMPKEADAVDFLNIFADSNQRLFDKWFEGKLLFSKDFSGYNSDSTCSNINCFPAEVLEVVFSTFLNDLRGS